MGLIGGLGVRSFDVRSSKFWFSCGLISQILCSKLREVCRIHFHLVAPHKSSMVLSYDQKKDLIGVLGGLDVRSSSFPGNFVRKIDRQLPGKQAKTVQNVPLKLLPKNRK